MAPEHRPLFETLCHTFDVLVISGTAAWRMKERLPGAPYYLFAENGNHAFSREGNELWRNGLSKEQKQMVFERIEQMKKHLALTVKDENDLVEDRDVQIAYSLIGHNEELEKKEAFDPKGEKRRQLLAIFAKDVDALEAAGIEIKIGGTTTIDFFRFGKNKASNIRALMEAKEWKGQDCLYIGDALYPGGNDEVMIGVVPTKEVKSPAECFAHLAALGAV